MYLTCVLVHGKNMSETRANPCPIMQLSTKSNIPLALHLVFHSLSVHFFSVTFLADITEAIHHTEENP